MDTHIFSPRMRAKNDIRSLCKSLGNDKALKSRAKLIRSLPRPGTVVALFFQRPSTHGALGFFFTSRQQRLNSAVADATLDLSHSIPGVETPG
jgi:hypothetical protein